MTGKYISISVIIEMMVTRYYKNVISPVDLHFNEVLEYTADYVDLFGDSVVFIDENEELEVEDYKTEIPSTLMRLEFMRDSEDGTPIYRSTDKMAISDNKINVAQPTFIENDGYYVFNFEEGTVEVVYKAYPTDDSGYPMIPDDTTIKMALMHYIAKNIITNLWMQGKVADKVKDYASKQCSFYTKRANNRAKIGDRHTMENIKNMILQQYPKVNAHDLSNASRGIQMQKPVKNTW